MTDGWAWISGHLDALNIPSNVFYIALSVRLLNALTLCTFFQPDEYWQALEPAHQLVYGYGFLTWEWRLGLRSFLHPLLYTAVYKVCDWLDLSYPWILYLPKVLNGIIASIGEVYLYKFAKKTTSPSLAVLTLLLSLLSSFNWYCSTRSFSNSLEMHLTTVALYLFPQHLGLSMLVAASACIIRPTNAIIWASLGIAYLLRVPWKRRLTTVLVTSLVGTVVVVADILLNRWYYGEWSVPMRKFLEFNVSRNLSAFYGVSQPDFYFFQALPILMLNLLPFFLWGFYKAPVNLRIYKITSVVYLLIFSLIQHKEFRFIYPLMPLFLLFTATGLSAILRKCTVARSKAILALTISLSAFISFYFSIYHESGVIQITQDLRKRALSRDFTEVGFITPCHSTPYQSYFHLEPERADIWWLTCEPPLHLNSSANLASYRDESDQFYDDPEGFMKTNFPPLESQIVPQTANYPHQWPDYLVFFQHIEPFLKVYLNGTYTEDERLFNSRFHWDYRRRGELIVYKRAD